MMKYLLFFGLTVCCPLRTVAQDNADTKKNLVGVFVQPGYLFSAYYDLSGKAGDMVSYESNSLSSFISLSYERNIHSLSVGAQGDFYIFYPKYFYLSSTIKYRNPDKKSQIVPIIQGGISNFKLVNPFAGIGTQFEYKRVMLSARYYHVFIPDSKTRFYVHKERLILFGIGLKLGSLPR
jgi:hypothetical protein